MRIRKSESAGLIIDIQTVLLPHIHENEALVANTAKLIKGLAILEVPLILTEQYKKGLGETTPVLMNEIGKHDYFEKKAFSCCDDPLFMEALYKHGRKFVIIAGIESHVCVLQTAIDLKQMGFTPVVVEDCVSSRTADNKRVALQRMLQEGAIITTTESLLFELCQCSSDPAFKDISKLVK